MSTASAKPPTLRFRRYAAYKDSGVEWLGNIPAHWEIAPLVTVARERDVHNAGGQETNVLSLSYGRIVRRDVSDNFGLLPESFDTYQIVEPSDIVLRLTDLQNDKRSLRVGFVNERGIITSAYVALRIHARLVPEYVASLLHAYDVTKVFYSLGGGVRQTMKFEDLKWMPLLLPDSSEQRAIATFLDRETARIGALVAKKERLIELLQEQRTALITRAVTKGLDPKIPMKDSGVESLGEIPAHWEAKRIKFIAQVGNGSTPNRDNGDYWGGEYPWLNSSVVNLREVKEGVDFVTARALAECHLPRVLPPAVLVGITGEGRTRGMATVLRVEATLNQHLAFIRPTCSYADVEYIRYVFHSAYRFLRDESGGGGSTKGALTCEQLENMSIPFPPEPEQRKIAAFLDRETSRIDALVAKVREAIDRLQELRTALISAAVTGKIDVRGEAA